MGDAEQYEEADAAMREKRLRDPDMEEELDLDEAAARNVAPYVDTQPRTPTPYGDSPFVVHAITTMDSPWYDTNTEHELDKEAVRMSMEKEHASLAKLQCLRRWTRRSSWCSQERAPSRVDGYSWTKGSGV